MSEDERKEAHVEAALATHETDTSRGWLEPIFQEHSANVFKAACRVTGNAADAEDVLQTVFLRLARREDSLDLGSGAGAYLRRAATNAALDIVTSRRVRSGTTLEAVAEPVADERSAPEKRHLDRELAERLRQALCRLNRKAAQVFALRYFEDMDNRQIAAQLGTSAGVVAVTLHRARVALRRDLQSYIGGGQ